MRNRCNISIFKRLLLYAVGIVLIAGAVSLSGKAPVPEEKDRFALVVRVIDGDTVVIEGGERVRYIGIDTPESKHPRRPVEPFALEASEFNRKLVDGKRVFLVMGSEPRDRYGRLLAYVFAGDVFVNARLVSYGLARERAYPPNLKFRPLFMSLQDEAKFSEKGFWSQKHETVKE